MKIRGSGNNQAGIAVFLVAKLMYAPGAVATAGEPLNTSALLTGVTPLRR